jgi:GTP cyclohydrolase II
LDKIKDYTEEDLKLSPQEVIKLIKKKTSNIFEHEKLFNTDLPDYGNVENILNKHDSRRVRLVTNIRKKVKVELIFISYVLSVKIVSKISYI